MDPMVGIKTIREVEDRISFFGILEAPRRQSQDPYAINSADRKGSKELSDAKRIDRCTSGRQTKLTVERMDLKDEEGIQFIQNLRTSNKNPKPPARPESLEFLINEYNTFMNNAGPERAMKNILEKLQGGEV